MRRATGLLRAGAAQRSGGAVVKRVASRWARPLGKAEEGSSWHAGIMRPMASRLATSARSSGGSSRDADSDSDSEYSDSDAETESEEDSGDEEVGLSGPVLGSHVFRPLKWMHRAIDRSIADAKPLDAEDSKDIAEAMHEWAHGLGARSFAHWASPVRGPNHLLKHDAFVDMDFAENRPRWGFSAARLLFSETDGSSFPNGGLRDTHEAAGYLTWDKKSPVFVRGDTMYIPSGFISWKGDALDEKTPLLRSQAAVSRAGARLLGLLGHADEAAAGVVCNVGWEQEFFLVSREHFLARPDLVACGRTLVGAPPPRGQQTDQNYFSRVPPRVKAVLEDAQRELHRMGVSLSVYHAEVAPGQYEVSPIFSVANASADSNVLAMDVLQEAAGARGLVALFHEKPFAGANGSGKHCNWGANVGGSGRNLFVPGKTAEHQRCFTAVVACLLRAVHLHGGLLRAAVASAGNDHRLGAQEAPPAIMSLCLGDALGAHCQRIADAAPDPADPAAPGALGIALDGYAPAKKVVGFGSPELEPVGGASEDRNRTAPFPFCGNRFEFRAVGSDMHMGFPVACVQAAFADSMDALSAKVEAGEAVEAAVAGLLRAHLPAMFNGDGYAADWREREAPARGLPNLPTTVDALGALASADSQALLRRTGVLQPHEADARLAVLRDKYTQTVLMEANCLLDMMQTGALPACAADLRLYEGGGPAANALVGNRAELYGALHECTGRLGLALDRFPHDAGEEAQARECADALLPLMEEVRAEADLAERSVRAGLWPFPSYHDMLFQPQSLPRESLPAERAF